MLHTITSVVVTDPAYYDEGRRFDSQYIYGCSNTR